jgi:hypothetical protein
MRLPTAALSGILLLAGIASAEYEWNEKPRRFVQVELVSSALSLIPYSAEMRYGSATFLKDRWRLGAGVVAGYSVWGPDATGKPILALLPVRVGYTLLQFPRPIVGFWKGMVPEVLVEARTGLACDVWLPTAGASLVWQLDYVGLGIGFEIGADVVPYSSWDHTTKWGIGGGLGVRFRAGAATFALPNPSGDEGSWGRKL